MPYSDDISYKLEHEKVHTFIFEEVTFASIKIFFDYLNAILKKHDDKTPFLLSINFQKATSLPIGKFANGWEDLAIQREYQLPIFYEAVLYDKSVVTPALMGLINLLGNQRSSVSPLRWRIFTGKEEDAIQWLMNFTS